MMTEELLNRFAADLAAANHLPMEMALQYACLIGDTPELDGHGNLVVRDHAGAEIARFPIQGELRDWFDDLDETSG
jgi:hypothetical protein